VIVKSLAKQAEDRFNTVMEMVQAFCIAVPEIPTDEQKKSTEDKSILPKKSIPSQSIHKIKMGKPRARSEWQRVWLSIGITIALIIAVVIGFFFIGNPQGKPTSGSPTTVVKLTTTSVSEVPVVVATISATHNILDTTQTQSPTQTVSPTQTPTIKPTPTFIGGGRGQIAFSARINEESNEEIFLLDINQPESTPINLTNNFSRDYSPNWSPDGQKIVFVSLRDGNPEIYSMNSDGKEQVNLTRNLSYDFDPSWSPDSSMIAFTRNGEIFVMNSDGSNVKQLTYNPAYDCDPAWLPDGKTIVFASGRDDPDLDCKICNFELYLIDLDGENITRLTNRPSYEDLPSVSPDGNRIAFVSTLYSSYDIFTISTNGFDWNRITSSSIDEYDPSWSPDGNYLVYIFGKDGIGSIRIIRSNDSDGNSKIIISMLDVAEPTWRP